MKPSEYACETSRLRNSMYAFRALSTGFYSGGLVAAAAFAARPGFAVPVIALALLAAGEIFRAVFLSERKQCAALWNDFYRGTRWRTPAGEDASFVETDARAVVLTVEFASGLRRNWNVADLALVGDDGLMRLTAEDIDAVPYGHNFGRAISNILCAGAPFVAAAWLVGDCADYATERPLVVGVASAVIAAFVAASCRWVFIIDAADQYEANPLLATVSVTRWRTLDGRVGTVRGARRQSGENVFNVDFITLALDDGTEREFERPDLRPVETADESAPLAA